MQFWQGVAFLEPSQLLPLAQATDEAGYDGIAISDHLFFPKQRIADYPYTPDGAPIWEPDTPWPDPWTTIAAMAAVTEHLRFTTNVYVAPARDLFTVAKQVSTAAVLSGGRVALGVGAGWSEDEFRQTGQDFATRGRRLDEMLPALRALWSDGWAEYHGDHVDFDPVQVEPTPPAPVPIYVGGDSPAALRRAARLGDGWLGIGYKPDAAAERIAALTRLLDEHGRDRDDFEIIVTLYARPSVELYRRFEDLGVTGVVWAPWMMAGPDLDDRVEATKRFADEIIAPMR